MKLMQNLKTMQNLTFQKFKTMRQKSLERKELRIEQKYQRFSGMDEINTRLFDLEMRSFDKRVQRAGRIKDPSERSEAGQMLAEEAKRLIKAYSHDQREKHKKRVYLNAITDKRDDLIEYYSDRRDHLTTQVGRHWAVLNAAGLAVLAVRRGKDPVWTLGVANGLALMEFIVRNGRLDRQQTQAESGWKMVQEYAPAPKPAEDEIQNIPAAPRPRNGTGAGREKKKDGKGERKGKEFEYAD